jgi:hypothetical protein
MNLRPLAVAACAAASCLALLAAPAAGPAQAATHTARNARTNPPPGHWTKLGIAQGAPAVLWRGPDNRGWVAWAPAKSGQYELAIMAPGGKIAAAPRLIVKGWSGVTAQPSLLGSGSVPLLIFSGQDNVPGPLSEGCVVGALAGSGLWKIQSWSLSSNCVFSNVGYGDASENSRGVLSAAWAGGTGVEYRIGTSPVIPAKGKDQQIATPFAHAGMVAEANNRFGNGHTYVAFNRFFSANKSKDGVYVKDVTANSAVLKAPGSGTAGVSWVNQRIPMVNVSGAGGGIYLAYCSNTAACGTYLLWKAGAKKAIDVPHTKGAVGLAMSQGPGGRLWLAWYDEQNNRVYTVSTNQTRTKFGTERSYPTPCFEDGNTHLSLTGGNWSRVDVALECISSSKLQATLYVTQSVS